jgi:hypothetical protein
MPNLIRGGVVSMNRILLCLVVSLLPVLQGHALDVDDLSELLGFTLVALTEVPGEFEGADFDKTVKLGNGMVFEFASYSYTYAYQPSAAVFAKKVTREELAKLGRPATKDIVLYKLVVEDEIYDVIRLR